MLIFKVGFRFFHLYFQVLFSFVVVNVNVIFKFYNIINYCCWENICLSCTICLEKVGYLYAKSLDQDNENSDRSKLKTNHM